ALPHGPDSSSLRAQGLARAESDRAFLDHLRHARSGGPGHDEDQVIAMAHVRQAYRATDVTPPTDVDKVVVLSTIGLLVVGVIMVASTSIAVADSYSVSVWHFLAKHMIFIILGLTFAAVVATIG